MTELTVIARTRPPFADRRRGPAERRGPAADAVLFRDWFDDLTVCTRFRTSHRAITQADAELCCALSDRFDGGERVGPDDELTVLGRAFPRHVVRALLLLFCSSGSVTLDPERVIGVRRITAPRVFELLEPGDDVRLDACISALRALDPHRGVAVCSLMFLQQQDRLVATATIELLCRRRAHRPAPADRYHVSDWNLAAEVPV